MSKHILSRAVVSAMGCLLVGSKAQAVVIDNFSVSDPTNYSQLKSYGSNFDTFAVSSGSFLPTGGSGSTNEFLRKTGEAVSHVGDSVSIGIDGHTTSAGGQVGLYLNTSLTVANQTWAEINLTTGTSPAFAGTNHNTSTAISGTQTGPTTLTARLTSIVGNTDYFTVTVAGGGLSGSALYWASPLATNALLYFGMEEFNNPAPESNLSFTHQPIISLTATAPTTYGSQLGTAISINGSSGNYTTGDTGLVTGQTTAFTKVSTFTPGTDVQVFALKLSQGGVPIDPSNTALINAIINDINTSTGTNPGNTGNITASMITSSYAGVFPGYDILLSATVGVGSTPYLGIDFASDTTNAGITVAEIAAVPEPVTSAALILGTTGLLLGRRSRRTAPSMGTDNVRTARADTSTLKSRFLFAMIRFRRPAAPRVRFSA